MANLLLIKAFAKERRIPLKEVASKAGITEQGLWKLIHENSTSVATLENISNALGVSPAVFFGDAPAASANASGDGAIAIAGSGNVTIPKEVLDMLAQKDARIKELTDRLLAL